MFYMTQEPSLRRETQRVFDARFCHWTGTGAGRVGRGGNAPAWSQMCEFFTLCRKDFMT